MRSQTKRKEAETGTDRQTDREHKKKGQDKTRRQERLLFTNINLNEEKKKRTEGWRKEIEVNILLLGLIQLLVTKRKNESIEE